MVSGIQQNLNTINLQPHDIDDEQIEGNCDNPALFDIFISRAKDLCEDSSSKRNMSPICLPWKTLTFLT